MKSKKDHLLPPLRIPEAIAREYDEALAHYGTDRPTFARAVIMALIKHAERGNELLMPIMLRYEREVECPYCGRKHWNSEGH